LRNTTGCTAFALFAFALLIFTSPAHAAFQPRISVATQTINDKTFASVTINDRPAFTLRTSAGGYPPSERADAAAGRLQGVVENWALPVAVKAVKVDGSTWSITIHDGSLLLVTSAEAAAHGMKLPDLARTWAKNIHDLLAEPPFTVSKRSLIVPMRETRTVVIGGAVSTDQITMTSSSPGVAQLQFNPATRRLIVGGAAAGKTVVSIRAAQGQSSAQLDFTVSVLKYAAQIDPTATVTITGTPAASLATTYTAIYTGLSRAIAPEPGARVRFLSKPEISRPPAPGERIRVTVPVTVRGANLLPVESSATITVVNQAVGQRPASRLFYSNHPERVMRSQNLFLAKIFPDIATRLDYHHQNGSGQPLIFHADLINSSETPVRVHMIAGISDPGTDTIQVGRRAGSRYLRASQANDGTVLDVPAYSRIPIISQRLGVEQTVSGIVDLRPIGGGPAVTLSISADGDDQTVSSPITALLTATAGNSAFISPALDHSSEGESSEALSPWVFGPPLIERDASFSVGGSWTYMRIGNNDSLKDTTGKLLLYGNYGVDYVINLKLSNPTTELKTVGLFFAPEAGSVAGVFRVDDGPIIEFDPTLPPNEPIIGRIPLAAGETRTVRLRTMPLNGSFYPMSIIAHSL
jgi:hypothetical protein